MENVESRKNTGRMIESISNAGVGPDPMQVWKERVITVEPVIFFVIFATTLTNAIFTNLILVRSCEFLGYPKENCTDMNTHSGSPAELHVHPFVTQLCMYKTLIEAFFPALMSFFLGPWSDANGRKPLIIVTIIGYSVYFLLMLGFTALQLSPYYVLFTTIPLVVSGGFISYISTCFSYICDVTDSGNRTIRIAIAESVLFVGLILSTSASSYLYTVFPAHGYEGVIIVSLGCCVIALVYTVYILPESISSTESRNSRSLSSILDFNRVRDTFRTCCQPRPGYSRAIIFIIVGASAMNTLTFEGNASVSFLFAREKFHWTLRDYTTFVDAALLFTLFGVLVGTATFSSWLNFPPAPLACVAFLIRSGAYVMAAISVESWYLYVSSAISCIGGVTGPICRTIICDAVSKKEIGKLFALASTVDAFMPIIATPLYTLLYNATLSSFSGAFFLLTAVISAMCSILLGVVGVLQRYNSSPQFTDLEDESVNEDEVAHLSSASS